MAHENLLRQNVPAKISGVSCPLRSQLEIMYYPDLSLYEYSQQDLGSTVLNVGWLNIKHSYAQKSVSEAFLDRLWIFCCNSVFHTLGFHRCPFCNKQGGFMTKHGEEQLSLGAAEIVVFAENRIAYIAPNLIYHYIKEHHYFPPELFIKAVLEGPLPSSNEYETLMKQYKIPFFKLADI